MAQLIITGTVLESKQDYEIEALVGTETFADTIDASHVGLVLDSAVAKRSLNVDVVAKRLAEALREAGYAA